ncbi:hypothetical protein S40285_00813 [Stachybotrys chlorohalonatus IBT 40285]|uniref:RNB domain-containing protein n=1 Tax=Stachybotrys chlorohalonatus (strain IBT 40285) TaxID=1283841 RepID=A0A084QJH9_STAC4|nr:hypothetical protein S40285_00813 [Stachybotrys chlorohalonata IBT 40285]
MLQNSSRPFICRQCLAHAKPYIRPAKHTPSSKGWLAQRRVAWGVQRNLATTVDSRVGPGSHGHDSSATAPGASVSSIRQHLRQWEKENRKQPLLKLGDSMVLGTIPNTLNQVQSTDASELENLRPLEDSDTDAGVADFNDVDHDMGVSVSANAPGDLVELRQLGSRTPVLAVYLGYFGARNHFFAASGKWVIGIGFSPVFTVSKFAQLTDLLPVLAKIPRNVTDPDTFDQLRLDGLGPTKQDGALLVQKMGKFRMLSERVYQDNLSRLDRAQSMLADQYSPKYLSLFEIAQILLPAHLKRDTAFPPYALYAVHTALSRDDFTFRPLSPSGDCHRRDHIFEIAPQRQIALADRVATMIREYTVFGSLNLRPPTPDELGKTPLGRFVQVARQRVIASRTQRSWTPHGVIHAPEPVKLPQAKWTKDDNDIITFLEWWASYRLFEASSPFHSSGSTILRALNLYEDAPLNQSTAWSFLQEIGVIPPWEIPARYKVRLPDATIIKGGGLERDVPEDFQASKRPDIALGARKDWGNTPVFCIDGPTTVVIDDGVSLERTENSDEFWIHVHTADPASVIQPDSALRRFMELIPENIYLPGHFQAMLPSDLGTDTSKGDASQGFVEEYSLRPGGSSLSFSAKVNRSGDILEYKIEPSTIHNVMYLDPTDVAAFCNEPTPPAMPTTKLSVGTTQQQPDVPKRPMLAAKDLDKPYQDDILQLYSLSEAIKQKRLDKGAWPYFFPRPSAKVSFNDPPKVGTKSDSLVLPAAPRIDVSYETSTGCSVVSNTMVLAGEIAARWCAARGIPVPFRRDTKLDENREAALATVFEKIYPVIKQGIAPTMGMRQELLNLTGGVELSTSPGPYFLLGLDMYAKATSPLRRFSDLLVHWQIHAALDYERKTGTTLDGSKVGELSQLLPFTQKTLADMLPLLHIRERMTRTIAQGNYEWILLALIHAWKYEQTLPKTFVFTVDVKWRSNLIGRIDLFDLRSTMDLEGLDDKVLLADIRTGDRFEVEIAHVNVHSREILVKALNYLGAPAKDAIASTAAV